MTPDAESRPYDTEYGYNLGLRTALTICLQADCTPAKTSQAKLQNIIDELRDAIHRSSLDLYGMEADAP